VLSVCVLGCALCLVLDGVQSTLPDPSTVHVLGTLLISAAVMRLAPCALVCTDSILRIFVLHYVMIYDLFILFHNLSAIHEYRIILPACYLLPVSIRWCAC
jgi:hypothetical protein